MPGGEAFGAATRIIGDSAQGPPVHGKPNGVSGRTLDRELGRVDCLAVYAGLGRRLAGRYLRHADQVRAVQLDAVAVRSPVLGRIRLPFRHRLHVDLWPGHRRVRPRWSPAHPEGWAWALLDEVDGVDGRCFGRGRRGNQTSKRELYHQLCVRLAAAARPPPSRSIPARTGSRPRGWPATWPDEFTCADDFPVALGRVNWAKSGHAGS